MIYSGSMAVRLARYRLDPNHSGPALEFPFAGIRFAHPETKWFNVNSSLGSKTNFPKNSPQILDLFARLVVADMAAGKQSLLIVQKNCLRLCQGEMQRRLRELGQLEAKVVVGHWSRHDLHNPLIVPMITYGVVGLNCFKHFNCAYCLHSFNIPAKVVEETLNDLEPSGRHHGVSIITTGSPARRRVELVRPHPGDSIVSRIAPDVLIAKEADAVLQATGRIRPFTQARRVITFQRGTLPGVEYTHEFRNLADVRAHFRIPAPKAGEIQTPPPPIVSGTLPVGSVPVTETSSAKMPFTNSRRLPLP